MATIQIDRRTLRRTNDDNANYQAAYRLTATGYLTKQYSNMRGRVEGRTRGPADWKGIVRRRPIHPPEAMINSRYGISSASTV